jgi:hypothetical protein
MQDLTLLGWLAARVRGGLPPSGIMHDPSHSARHLPDYMPPMASRLPCDVLGPACYT